MAETIPSIHTLFALCETARLIASSETANQHNKHTGIADPRAASSPASSSSSSSSSRLCLTRPVTLHPSTSTSTSTSAQLTSEDSWRFPAHALRPHKATQKVSTPDACDTYDQKADYKPRDDDTRHKDEAALSIDDALDEKCEDDAIDPESRRMREVVFQQPLQFGLPINRRNPTIGHIVAQYVSQLERRNSYWDKKSTCVKRRKRTIVHSPDEIESKIRTGKKCKARVPVASTTADS